MFRGFKVDSLGLEDAKQAFTAPLETTGSILAEESLVERVVHDVEG